MYCSRQDFIPRLTDSQSSVLRLDQGIHHYFILTFLVWIIMSFTIYIVRDSCLNLIHTLFFVVDAPHVGLYNEHTLKKILLKQMSHLHCRIHIMRVCHKDLPCNLHYFCLKNFLKYQKYFAECKSRWLIALIIWFIFNWFHSNEPIKTLPK